MKRSLIILTVLLASVAIGQSLVQLHRGYHRFDILDATTLKIGGNLVSYGIGTIDSTSATMDTLLIPGFDATSTLIISPLASSAVFPTYYAIANDDSAVVAFWDSIGVAVHVTSYSYLAIP